MKIGDPVIVYTHEQTGDQHYTIDRIAVVTQIDPDGVPLGVHVLDTNAKAPAPFDPDLPPAERRVGLTYMRAAGEPAPDLAAYFNDPEVPGYVAPIEEAPQDARTPYQIERQELEVQQAKELEGDAGVGKDRALTENRHQRELAELDSRYNESGQPLPPLGVRGAPEPNLGATPPAPAKPAGLSLG